MNFSSSDRIRKKLNLSKYLAELAMLMGHPVHANELSSLEQVAAIRESAQKSRTQVIQSCVIPFSERCSRRFDNFIHRLHDANPSSIYAWTEYTFDCGALLIPSLTAIHFDFDFAINDNGILVFLTSDLKDKLLLDLSLSPQGEQLLRVETQGSHWSKVTY